jgi:hypothetical protein
MNKTTFFENQTNFFLKLTFFFLLSFSLPSAIFAQVSGIVFRDYNANGQRETSATYKEDLVQGITVTAFPTSGASQTATTNVNGAYSFIGLTLPIRIEFTGLPTGNYPSAAGTGNSTSVQFYSAASTTADFAINAPKDFAPAANLPIFIPKQWGHSSPDATASIHAGESALAMFTEGTTGLTPIPTSLATLGQIGNTWGTAFHKKSKTVFASTFYRGNGGFGPGGQSLILVQTQQEQIHSLVRSMAIFK